MKFFQKTLDLWTFVCYNTYAVNYGLKYEVTSVTGNRREFMWTSSWQRPRATNRKVTFFKVLQRDTHGIVYHMFETRQGVMVSIAITGGIKINGNTSYQN